LESAFAPGVSERPLEASEKDVARWAAMQVMFRMSKYGNIAHRDHTKLPSEQRERDIWVAPLTSVRDATLVDAMMERSQTVKRSFCIE